jgi:arylsulfatase A-like enzyme
MGYANGGQITTPNFNAMHERGVALSQYYVQPSCSPTRATLMTGRKPVHTGINFWIPNAAYGLPLNETTLPQVLNARGFKSHAVGKWHLGCHKTAYLPTFRGFDSFYGYYEGSEDYWTHNFYGHGLDFHYEEGQYCAIGNCSKLLWDAVGVADQPDYWAAYSTNLFTGAKLDT